jgi:hypothetical protein
MDLSTVDLADHTGSIYQAGYTSSSTMGNGRAR